MRMPLVWMLFFVSYLSFTQEATFEGFVHDDTTGQPIPYANLSFLQTLKGTSSDETGYFYLDLDQHFLEREVHISSLGYKDTIVPAKVIQMEKKVFMKEESFKLDEVLVTHSMGGAQVLNPVLPGNITSGFSSATTPWILALYFPNIGASKKYVDKITIFFQDNSRFKGVSSKFRLRIYSVDPDTKIPSRDILRKSLILESDRNEEYLSVDFSGIPIAMPKSGIYIGLEWLFVPNNWYKEPIHNTLSGTMRVEDRFAPTFAAIYQQDPNYRTMVYGMGEWTDFDVRSMDNNHKLIPAISLRTRSN